MKVGGFQIRKSLVIDFGSFSASDHIIISTWFCKCVNWRVWRNWILKDNSYTQPFSRNGTSNCVQEMRSIASRTSSNGNRFKKKMHVVFLKFGVHHIYFFPNPQKNCEVNLHPNSKI